MFHTFSTESFERSSDSSKQKADSSRRRPSTTRACEPCRHRKVKCNGELPCDSCRWYRKPAQCQYTDPSQRAMANKRPSDKLTHSLLHQYRVVFQKLFPNLLPEQLAGLSREELVDLITKDSPRRFLPPSSPLTPSVDEMIPEIHPDADILEAFQPMPEEGSEASDQHPTKNLHGVQDDVNALSLSVRQTSSYLGISSVMAVLRVIVWLDPEAQAFLRRTPEGSAMNSREATSPPTPTGFEESSSQTWGTSSSAWDEIPQINSYFAFFHPMIPLLDEQSFRDTYITRRRSDSRWLLLLSIVLALGSAVNGTAGDAGHRLYYLRARRYLSLETLGSAHLETVQALALLSGYYLHYLQLPNQAHSLMGTTLRLATALGLHRDYSESVALAQKEKAASSIDIRRRIWWCIFCLDSWACGPLGRPSMGRMSHAITAKVPQQPIVIASHTRPGVNADLLQANSMQIVTLLQENIQFAAISTKVEDALAFSPMIDEKERKALDTRYVDWYKASSVQDNTPKPTAAAEAIGVSVVKNIMRWRYLWARVVLHRPVLLWYAMRKSSFSNLSSERQATIQLCRELTSDLICDIGLTWAGRSPCIMSGWHACWLLYQATMVPLLSLFSDWTDQDVLEKSHAQIQTSMRVLTDQIAYAHTAKRSLEVVSLLYEAGKRHRSGKTHSVEQPRADSAELALPAQPPNIGLRLSPLTDSYSIQQFAVSHSLNTPHQELMMENMFDSLNWSFGSTDGNEDFADYANIGFYFDHMNIENQNNAQFASMPSFEPIFDPNQMSST